MARTPKPAPTPAEMQQLVDQMIARLSLRA